jgi:CheY-like chemotaxis protein
VLRYDLMADLPLCQADATQRRQVIRNLIINASEAIGDRSGAITVATGAAWCDADCLRENHVDDNLAEGLSVHLEVAETGHAMSLEVRARIFDPFFTTKFTGRGLGLAAVLGIVRSHGGAIRVYSARGRGTTFKLLFPALAAASDAAARHMLELLGFRVVTAADGREAVSRYRELLDDAPLVLLDLTMPHLDGAGAFRALRQLRPDVRVVLMSGYSEHAVEPQFAGKGLAGFVQKPFRLDALRRAMRQALEGSAAR